MEFGALQCVPKNPNCMDCILKQICVACQSGLVDTLPVKLKSATIVTRYFHYLRIRLANRTFICQRPAGDIWTGLYEFPLIETNTEINIDELTRTHDWQSYFTGQTPLVVNVSKEITHRLTHRILKIKFYEIVVNQPIYGQDFFEIPENEIYRYAVPVVIDKYLKPFSFYFVK
jgi:A/G-specific adenine glycosylase